MKKFFITGEGFIGLHLIEKILARNYVYALVIIILWNIGWLENSINNKNLKIFYGELKDPDTHYKYLKKSDYVVNLASISVPYSYIVSKSNLKIMC